MRICEPLPRGYDPHMSADKKTILVIDDDQNICDLLSHLLKRQGYLVHTTLNGWEAMELLRKEPSTPDLILLDLRMPVMDGWKFRELQREDPRLAAIPVVVITSVQTIEEDTRSIDAAGFFKKPIQTDLLVRTVDDHLRK